MRLRTAARLFAVHARDAIDFERASLLVAARHQRSTLDLRDQLGDELNGEHRFSRTNLSLGATYAVTPHVTLFASAGEASRAPTAMEVTCADPDDPCRLPNAFVSDPPLDQVVTRTFEAGARGAIGRWRWNAAAFDARNRDDLLFIASGTTQGEGYFSNVGDTHRRGLELQMRSSVWTASYAYLDASFGERVVLPSLDGPAVVDPGDRIPGLPRHVIKGSWLVALSSSLRTGIEGRFQSAHYARGDEANRRDPIDGYAIANARIDWHNGGFMVVVSVENVFDERYATFGLLAEPDDVLGDEYDDPLFISPGAPRNVRLVSWRM